MNVIEGQQIGYNSRFLFYISRVGDFLATWFFVAFLWVIFTKDPIRTDNYDRIGILLISVMLWSFLFVKVVKKRKGKLKYFFFKHHLLNNNKEETPFSIFEYATISNQKCTIISKSRKNQVRFNITKELDDNEFLKLLNKKIKTANEATVSAVGLSNALEGVE